MTIIREDRYCQTLGCLDVSGMKDAKIGRKVIQEHC